MKETPSAETVSKEEWMRRYKARFIQVAQLTDQEANDVASAVTFEEASEDFEDDPEGAADSEMSYWEEE
jgi:hypothetical protein